LHCILHSSDSVGEYESSEHTFQDVSSSVFAYPSRTKVARVRCMRRNAIIFALIVVFSQVGDWTSVLADQSLQIYGEFTGDDFTIQNCENFLPTVATSTKYAFTLPQSETFTPATFPTWSQTQSLGYGGDTTAQIASARCATIASNGANNWALGLGGGASTGTFYLWWYDTFNSPIGYTQINYVASGTSTTPSGENALGTSRFIAYNSPVYNLATTTYVNFNFDYFNSGYEVFDKAGVEIRDVTAQYALVPVEEDVNLVGFSNYSQNYTLTAGHAHMWRPYLKNSASSSVPTLYGRWIGVVDVVTPSASSTPYLASSTTATSTAFFDFLNVPYLLQTKVPFAYFYQVSDLLTTLSSTTATSTGSVTYDFGEYASGTVLSSLGEVTLFSTSTVTQLIPSWILALFRALIVAILYVSAGMYVFHDVRNIKL